MSSRTTSDTQLSSDLVPKPGLASQRSVGPGNVSSMAGRRDGGWLERESRRTPADQIAMEPLSSGILELEDDLSVHDGACKAKAEGEPWRTLQLRVALT